MPSSARGTSLLTKQRTGQWLFPKDPNDSDPQEFVLEKSRSTLEEGRRDFIAFENVKFTNFVELTRTGKPKPRTRILSCKLNTSQCDALKEAASLVDPDFSVGHESLPSSGEHVNEYEQQRKLRIKENQAAMRRFGVFASKELLEEDVRQQRKPPSPGSSDEESFVPSPGKSADDTSDDEQSAAEESADNEIADCSSADYESATSEGLTLSTSSRKVTNNTRSRPLNNPSLTQRTPPPLIG